MKKLLFASAAVAIFALFSCKDSGKTADAGTDANAKYKEMNNMIYHTIETGDTAGLRNWIAADGIDHGGAPDGGDIKGADSIIAMISHIHTCFQPGFKSTPINTSTDGEYLYTLSSMSGTTTAAPGMGMPPNTKMDMMQVDVVKIKDGKASEHWNYVNMADAMKMMGGAPGPMPAAPADKKMVDTAKKM